MAETGADYGARAQPCAQMHSVGACHFKDQTQRALSVRWPEAVASWRARDRECEGLARIARCHGVRGETSIGDVRMPALQGQRLDSSIGVVGTLPQAKLVERRCLCGCSGG